MLNLYERLKTLPLFTGLTGEEISQIMGQTKFSFSKYEAGEYIKREGEPCANLTFIISGCAKAITYADDHGYAVEEVVRAPYVLQPERLFGLTQRYASSFVASDTCDTLSIDKNDIMRLTDEFVVFKINVISTISAVAQKAERQPWHTVDGRHGSRLMLFLRSHVSCPSGPKTIRIKMTRLALETNQSRLAVSQELNRLRSLGLLSFSRGVISIPAFERLSQDYK